MNAFGVTELGNNKAVEDSIRAAYPGYYAKLFFLWKNTHDDEAYHSSYVGKICAKTLTKSGLLSTKYGNITIELPNGKRFEVYAPDASVRKSINGGGYSFKTIDRKINAALADELRIFLPSGMERQYYLYSGDVTILNPNVPQEKQTIVELLQSMKRIQEEKRAAEWKRQEEAKAFAAQKAAKERALKEKMDAVDLDALCRGF